MVPIRRAAPEPSAWPSSFAHQTAVCRSLTSWLRRHSRHDRERPTPYLSRPPCMSKGLRMLDNDMETPTTTLNSLLRASRSMETPIRTNISKPSEYAPLPVPNPGSCPRRRGCLWCLGRLSLRTPTLPSSLASPMPPSLPTPPPHPIHWITAFASQQPHPPRAHQPCFSCG